MTTGNGVEVGGKDAGRRLDPVWAGPASGTTGGWSVRNTEALVGSTTLISSPTGTARSCGGVWYNLAERDLDDED